tara:strand:+ start:1915 stop:2811 length:897 start_codon:yes stop_codon:yes gene_type:complete
LAHLSFAFKTLTRLVTAQPRDCPYCGARETQLLARKKLLLELRRCPDCLLKFRYPKEDARSNLEFYQEEYSEGMTTEMPSDAEIARLMETNFAGSDRDLSINVGLVDRHARKGRLLDYGCSWGYGLHQFRQAGFDAVGFEISKPRGDFGREKLSVEILNDFKQLEALTPGSFDVIHTSHVLEHVPDLKYALNTFRRLLADDGVLFIFVPNAAGQQAREMGLKWGHHISEKHVSALDAEFFRRSLPEYGFSLSFSSYPHNAAPRRADAQGVPQLDGIELLVIARREAEVVRLELASTGT